MTALPLPRMSVKGIENSFLLDFLGKDPRHCQSSKNIFPSFSPFFFFLIRGFLFQPPPTSKGTTFLFLLIKAEIFHWDCDGWNAWGIWVRGI